MWVQVCMSSCSCVRVCLFVTRNAAGPHSPCGMRDFQVQNRLLLWEEGRNKQERGGEGKEKCNEDNKIHDSSFHLFVNIVTVEPTACQQGKFLWFTNMTTVMVSQMESGQIYLIGMLGGKEALLHCKQLKRKVKLLMDENISSL